MTIKEGSLMVAEGLKTNPSLCPACMINTGLYRSLVGRVDIRDDHNMCESPTCMSHPGTSLKRVQIVRESHCVLNFRKSEI